MVNAEIHRPRKALREQVLGREVHRNHELRLIALGRKQLFREGQLLGRDLRIRVEAGLFVLPAQRTAKGGGTHHRVAVRILMGHQQVVIVGRQPLYAFLYGHCSSSPASSSGRMSSSFSRLLICAPYSMLWSSSNTSSGV